MSETQPAPAPQPGGPTGRPGRYQRSASGLVGAMIVLVLVVLAFVAFRDFFRERPVVRPEPVDWADVVAQAQARDLTIYHPEAVPEGWIATSANLEIGPPPEFSLGMLNRADRFVGVRQSTESLEDVVEDYLDPQPVAGDDLQVSGSVAPTWQEFSGADGDHGYAARIGDTTVLVYGRVPADQLVPIVESLTTDPVA